MGRILAIDFGRKRTGLAVTDVLRIAANPLLTIETKDLIPWLIDYIAREPVDEVVIGHPTQMNGTESESMNYIRPFMGVSHRKKRNPGRPEMGGNRDQGAEQTRRNPVRRPIPDRRALRFQGRIRNLRRRCPIGNLIQNVGVQKASRSFLRRRSA